MPPQVVRKPCSDISDVFLNVYIYIFLMFVLVERHTYCRFVYRNTDVIALILDMKFHVVWAFFLSDFLAFEVAHLV